MIFNIHAGHNPDGKAACGAVGLIKESTEARNVKDKVIALLKAEGHTVYDCTVDDGASQSDVLSGIVKKANAHKADLDVSIHFNSGRNDRQGDGSPGGAEAWIYSSSSKAKKAAQEVCKAIASLGFPNRGVKTSSSLYVLRKTAAPAMLIECCFVDDADDIKIYDRDAMAQAIAEGILSQIPGRKRQGARPLPKQPDRHTGASPFLSIHPKRKLERQPSGHSQSALPLAHNLLAALRQQAKQAPTPSLKKRGTYLMGLGRRGENTQQ